MSDARQRSDSDAAAVLAEVTKMIHGALLDYGEWSAPITPDARLDADLGMQSLEFCAFQEALVRRWGPAADLAPLLQSLTLTALSELTLAAVAAHVAGCIAPGERR